MAVGGRVALAVLLVGLATAMPSCASAEDGFREQIPLGAFANLGAPDDIAGTSTRGNAAVSTRVPPKHHASLTRSVVHDIDWGVVSTTSVRLGNNIAFGNALSFSDGPPGYSTGRLLFYLTPMDETWQDISAKPFATLTLNEAQIPEACDELDPQDPQCIKVSITGKMLPVPEEELHLAKKLLFGRHPDMRLWPAEHNFTIFELHPTAIRIIDYYGSAHDISTEEYFKVNLTYNNLDEEDMLSEILVD